MDQYFAQMDKIIKEKKTSSRIRFMLQDVLDLRRVIPPNAHTHTSVWGMLQPPHLNLLVISNLI